MRRTNRVWVLVLVLGFAGCKTPNRYIPVLDGAADEEVEGGAPAPTPDASMKADTAVTPDLAAADTATSAAPDVAPPGPDVVPADTAPPPCTNGTARCAPSGTAVEMCTNGQWTTKETCSLTCSAAACTAVCMGGVACTQGIAPCHKGATFCATPGSAPTCNDSGVDDSRGGCSGGNVCKNGDCVAPCKAGVACTQGIPPCHKGATFCATPTSAPACNDLGADDSKGGCTGGKVCSGGQCVTDPCAGPSSGNLVPNAGFDSSVWPKLPNSTSGVGNWSSSDANGCARSGSLQISKDDAPGICIGFGDTTKLYAGYMVNRSTAEGQLGCFVESWYKDIACQDAWDYGNESGLIAPNLTGWQQVATMIFPPPTTKSFILQCNHTYMTTAPFLIDRFYVRTSPGGF